MASVICWALRLNVGTRAPSAGARKRLVGFSSKDGNSRQPTDVLEAGEPDIERPRQISGGENRAVGADGRGRMAPRRMGPPPVAVGDDDIEVDGFIML